MLSFINISILSLLVAIAIPVLIHLFNKQRKKKVTFSSIRFLKSLEKNRLKRLKFYEYLLILLRTVLILTLVLAFARPTLISKSALVENGARSTCVILLDDGINMRRFDDKGNRFFRAVEIVHRIKAQYDSQDQVFVFPTSNPQKKFKSENFNHGLESSYRMGNWRLSIKEAEEIFNNNPNFNRELFIISDFQFQKNLFDANELQLGDVSLTLIKIGDDQIPNISIDSVVVENQIFEINKPLTFKVHLNSSNIDPSLTTELHLFVNDQRVAHSRVPGSQMNKQVATLSYLPKFAGFISGYIEIGDDDFLADNRYYFVLNIPDKIKLMFVDDHPSIYLKTALKVLNEKSVVDIVEENYNSWTRHNFQNYNIIFLSNLPMVTSPTIKKLKNYIENKGVLIISPGPMTIPSEFNNQFTSLLEIPRILNLVRTESSSEFYQIKSPDSNHPLLSGLFRNKKSDFSKPRFYQYFKFSKQPNTSALLSFQNGDPYIFQTDNRGGSIIFLTSYIDDAWTDIQYRGIYLPILNKLFNIAVSNQSIIQTPVLSGTRKTISVSSLDGVSSFTLEFPDGEKNQIIPDISSQYLTFYLPHTDIPGLYKISTGSQTVSIIPVNADRRFLYEPYVNTREISDNSNISVLSENAAFEEEIQKSRFGTELWKILIILALLLIGLELLIIKKIEGKSRTANPAGL